MINPNQDVSNPRKRRRGIETKKVLVSLPLELIDKFKRPNESFSQTITTILEKHLEEEDK